MAPKVTENLIDKIRGAAPTTHETISRGGGGDDDGSASDPDADEVSEHLLAIIEDAKAVDFADARQAKEFQSKHEKYITRRGKYKSTLLHEMVENTRDLEQVRSLLTWVIATYPAQFVKTDNREKETPLCSAFSRRKPDFVKFFLESKDAISAIKIPSKRSSCFHRATRDDPQFVPLLLEKAKGDERVLESVLRLRDDDGNTPLHVAVRIMTRPSHQKLQLDIVKRLIDSCPSAMDERNKKGESPYQYRYRLKKATGPIPYGEDEVADYLRLYSMRERKRSATVDFLYGDSQVHEIEFSLDGPTISEDDLHNLAQVLKFESILLYVDLPKLSVQKDHAPFLAQTSRSLSISTRKNLSLAAQQGKGSTDFGIIFDLLWDKGVRKILKVIVEDDKGTPHSDDVIEKSLRRFDIEVWDWKKFDLCSEVVYNAAPNVREITLYASGNNAVLRAWSAVDGLAKLKNLQTVRLFAKQGLEPRERVERYVREFKDRLLSARKDVKIIDKFMSEFDRNGELNLGSVDKPLPKKHHWLLSMENFAKFIQNLKEDSGEDVRVRETVKVALIDDGIDAEHFADNIAYGTSFCGSDESGKTKGYYVASGGHGTLMATLICNICPTARLYVARLDEYGSQDGGRQITAKSAAQAIRWAVRQGVDCISMSWTIEETANNKTELEDLQRAIRLAEDKNILMFAAANDQGAASTSLTSYPGALPAVFCIGAATATGKKWDWVSDDKVNFIFPGEKVMVDPRHGSARPPPSNALAQVAPSGSSIATALAAGLAALILYCVEVVDHDRRKGVRDYKHMYHAFKVLCNDGVDNYTKVWDVFGADWQDVEVRTEWEERMQGLVARLMGE